VNSQDIKKRGIYVVRIEKTAKKDEMINIKMLLLLLWERMHMFKSVHGFVQLREQNFRMKFIRESF